MSVFARLINVTKAAAHEALSKLEDPVMMMNHYLRDMEEEIEDLEKELAKQKVSEKGFAARIADLERFTEQSEAKAMEALVAGREAEARLALEAKLHYAEQARECVALYEMAKTGVAELTRQLEEAKATHATMQSKRAELAARAQKAVSQVRTAVHSIGSGFEGGTASRGFRRMEEKIMEWEVRAEMAGQRYAQSAAAAGAGSSSAYASAAGVERSAQIDEELERLRKRTNG
jgi:phage shock protein A